MARELRSLVPAEVAAVLVVAFVPLPEAVPRALILFAAACASRWSRGRDWAEIAHGPPVFAAIGALAGAVALALAVAIGTPVIEALTGRGVEWNQFPIVRGNSAGLFAVATVVAVSAIALELAVRGWLVERVLELAGDRADVRVLAVMGGGFADALVASGDFTARLGAGVFGIALGWMYLAAGRSVIAPACARAAFALGAVLLEALRLVG